MSILFYDTCSLLSLQQEAFNDGDKFYISSITLNELEDIKSSAKKDEEIKYNARVLSRLLYENRDKYEIILFNDSMNDWIKNNHLPDNNDSRIIACAYNLQREANEDVVFITEDLLCQKIAETVYLTAISTYTREKETYKGFKEIDFADDNELAEFYSNMGTNTNPYDLLENEYLIIKRQGEIIDKYKWQNEIYQKVPFQKLESKMFGKISPKNGDIYQQLAIDSLTTNKITLLRGPAGSGKSYLALGYLFSLLDKGTIDHIVIFCNTVATKGSAKLGFYPGSRTEKLLDSQIGNFLASKIGERGAVENMIDKGQILLLPMSDIRGFDTTDMNAAVYITEAQNLDIELMKLALQRIGEDSICILDGDSDTQVDMSMYAGSNNGMRRVSEVFRGQDVYGEVELQTIYRSKIADIANRM